MAMTFKDNIPLNNLVHRCYCYAVVQELVKVEKSTFLHDGISLVINVSAISQSYRNHNKCSRHNVLICLWPYLYPVTTQSII
jgi:hypothetical protein